MAESRRFGALPEVTDDLRAIRLENEKLGTLIIQKLADLRAVGEREALAVYLDALRRLGRAVGGDPS